MTPIKYGIDCATVLTDDTANALHNVGYDVAIRYLVPKTFSKHLSKEEAEILTAHKFKIGCVYETSGISARGGYASGKRDAMSALNCAKDLNLPKNACIYFAVDYEPVTTEDYYAISNYFIGIASIIQEYKIGVYGCYDVIEWLFRQKICNCFWQCVAWSYGKISEHATMYQRKGNAYMCGVYVDLNDIYADIGFWNYDPAPELVKTITVNVNGTDRPLHTVIVNGENYIRIRDIADLSDNDNITVSWDAEKEKMTFNTEGEKT